MDHAHVQKRLTIVVDGPGAGLLGGRRLLKESPQSAAGTGTVNAMMAGLLGRSGTRQARDSHRCEADLVGIEGQQHVARGDHDLAGEGVRRRKLLIDRQLAIEEGRAHGAVAAIWHGHEDLSTGPIGRQPLRVPPAVHDEDPHPSQHVDPRLRPCGVASRGQFPVQHRQQAVERAAAASHATAVGIGHDQDLSEPLEESQLPPHVNLIAERRGLGLVGSREDQVVPRGHVHKVAPISESAHQLPNGLGNPSYRVPAAERLKRADYSSGFDDGFRATNK